MKPKTAKIAMIVCSVGAMMALIIAMVNAQTDSMLYLFGGIGIGLMVASYVVQLLFWKCPYCGRALPSRGFWKLDSCPVCKSNL